MLAPRQASGSASLFDTGPAAPPRRDEPVGAPPRFRPDSRPMPPCGMKGTVRKVLLALLLLTSTAKAERLKELVTVEGVRSNPIIGYGIVVGLGGTGDDASSAATRRPMAAMMKRLGVTIAESELKAKNVAAVAITAELPPFARAGMKIDVTVSSLGSAKSLQGGTLLVTSLKGADLRTYALAQGPLTVGGFLASGASGSSAQKNHVTAARIPGGATVERAAPGKLEAAEVVLILKEADFTTATRIATAVDAAVGSPAAEVRDPAAVRVKIPEGEAVVAFLSKLEAIEVTPDVVARVIIDERTGTIVVGANVKLGPAAIAHSGLTVTVAETPVVSQPNQLADGKTVETPSTEIAVDEAPGRLVYTPGAATVADLAKALDAIGAKPRDLVAIFQALKSAGALRADLVVQ
jgi:flagellar P-ring protein FlgI